MVVSFRNSIKSTVVKNEVTPASAFLKCGPTVIIWSKLRDFANSKIWECSEALSSPNSNISPMMMVLEPAN